MAGDIIKVIEHFKKLTNAEKYEGKSCAFVQETVSAPVVTHL